MRTVGVLNLHQPAATRRHFVDGLGNWTLLLGIYLAGSSLGGLVVVSVLPSNSLGGSLFGDPLSILLAPYATVEESVRQTVFPYFWTSTSCSPNPPPLSGQYCYGDFHLVYGMSILLASALITSVAFASASTIVFVREVRRRRANDRARAVISKTPTKFD